MDEQTHARTWATLNDLPHSSNGGGIKMDHRFLRKASYVNDFGPRSRNDLDLQYSHTFINSISCLQQPTFRSRAAIVSEESTVFTFSYRKAYIIKFDLAVK